MNLETKITIYKFTPQVFTLTRKFHSAMVEQNFLRGGTKFTPWRNDLIEETAFSLCHREKGC